MRKLNFLFGVMAFAVAGLFTSCGDEATISGPKVIEQPTLDKTKTLYVQLTTSVPSAEIKFDGQTKHGSAASFTNVASDGQLIVTATGYRAVEKKIEFGSNDNMSVEITLVKISQETKAQSDVNNQANDVTVENDRPNKETSDADAEITVSANTTITNAGNGNPFSVTAFVPTSDETAEEPGSDVDYPAIALECEPSGAEFDKPVKLSVTTGHDLTGLEINCQNGNEEIPAQISGNTVSAEVNHFSVWSFLAKVTNMSVEEGDTIIASNSIIANEGQNRINYTQYVGYESGETNSLLINYLNNHFGSRVKPVSKSTTFTSTGYGSATYTVTQSFKRYRFLCGTKYFTAKVYGNATVNVTIKADTSGHSGGTGH